ncbi:hypothetical protein J113_14000 [Mycobacterium tuberculosis CAS/NITR204]|uniref:DUF3097 domain-containing protein n=1 Tax=Mycobacterium tuberculosis CAS/NITR204 TaxID=1310114 RepID=R4MEW9_MYCTX|nr:hypothetical protein J113_14000 [Mycobacterium tuberculosis CAS/NITR204]
MLDRYGTDVLAAGGRRRPRSVEHPVELGMVVEDAETGYVGAVVRVEYGRIDLEDRYGKTRGFPLGPGYLLDGLPVILTAPRCAAAAGPRRTASGSVAVPGARARVARASRIYVEGRHDAELIAAVWGADLRIEGVVVEHLGGVDDLVEIVAKFRPGPRRRLGVLVDHLVAGSKEARIAEVVRRGPRRLRHFGRRAPLRRHLAGGQATTSWATAWPRVPLAPTRSIFMAGWPHADQADIAAAWRRIRSQVRDWTDLEPALIGRVEELIDFVTQPAGDE